MTKVKSKKVIDALKAIQRRNGGKLLPEHVVKAAASPASPLHRYFDWDDTEAARRWRLQQAGDLIRVSVEVLPHADIETRVFVSLGSDRANGAGYRLTLDVLSDAELRGQLLADAKEELAAFKKRYAELVELAEVFAAIDKVK